MKKLFITGAMGQLGKTITYYCKKTGGYEFVLTDVVEDRELGVQALDIADEFAVMNLIDIEKPDIIINCAAMTAVDLCETEQEKAYTINALGPKNLAQAADKVGAKLIHISTDYVFDGQASIPYVESDETNPESVYGKTKLQGEEFVKQYCESSYIVRTAWLYGEGKSFLKTMLRLAESNNKLRVVHDQIGCPTSVVELTKAIMLLMESETYGIYHCVAEGQTNWNEFAKAIFEEAGIDITVEAITTAEYPTPAKRPQYSVLENRALKEKHHYQMLNWREALKEYMIVRKNFLD